MKRGLAWTLALCLPCLLWAYSTGPAPYSEGGPGGDPGACTQCHGGTGLNRGGGKVELQFPNGLTYVPGQKQRIKILITDVTAKLYGYQVSARLASNELNGQAGVLTALGGAPATWATPAATGGGDLGQALAAPAPAFAVRAALLARGAEAPCDVVVPDTKSVEIITASGFLSFTRFTNWV